MGGLPLHRIPAAQFCSILAGSRQLHRVRPTLQAANWRQTPCQPAALRTKRPGSAEPPPSYRGPAPAVAGTSQDFQARPPMPRFRSSARRASARWPDFESPFCAGCLLMNRNNGAIRCPAVVFLQTMRGNHGVFEVRVIAHSVEKLSKTPRSAHRLNRRNWLFQLPKFVGRSRHGEPVRTR